MTKLVQLELFGEHGVKLTPHTLYLEEECWEEGIHLLQQRPDILVIRVTLFELEDWETRRYKDDVPHIRAYTLTYSFSRMDGCWLKTDSREFTTIPGIAERVHR